MTKQQFLDNLRAASDWYNVDANGLIIQAGDGVIAYLQRQPFNHYFPGQRFFQVFIETRKTLQGEFTNGSHTWTNCVEIKTYDVTLPSVSAYSQYAADSGSRYDAGENGVTITRPGRESVYIPYSDITGIYSLGQPQQNVQGQDNPIITRYYNRSTPV